MTRAPKVGDFVFLGLRYVDCGPYRGQVARIVSVREKSVTLDAVQGGKAKVVTSDYRYTDSDPWHVLTYVAPAEAERWFAAKARAKAWRDSVPPGAKWVSSWNAPDHVAVDETPTLDADECDRRATAYAAVAAWLRAKPSADDLLITVEAA